MWVAQLVSTAGSSLTDLAAGIYVYSVTGSAFLVGVTLMATAVPSLVVGLIAGVFVDRYDRRSVMIWTSLVPGDRGRAHPVPARHQHGPAVRRDPRQRGRQAVLRPGLREPDPRDRHRTTSSPPPTPSCRSPRSGRRPSGSRGAGLLASAFSIEWAFWIDALTFLFSAGCIFFLQGPLEDGGRREDTSVGGRGRQPQDRHPDDRRHPDPAPAVPARRAGVLRLRPVERAAAADGDPGAGRDRVRVRPPGGPDLDRVRGRGAVHGPLQRPAADRQLADRSATSAWASAACSTRLSPTIAIAIVWVIADAASSTRPRRSARQTLLQRNTPRELRGRVFSGLYVMRDVIFLAGMAGAGLADIIDVRVMLVFSSLILVVVGDRRGRHARASGGRPPNGGAACRPCAPERRVAHDRRRPGRRPSSDFDRLAGRARDVQPAQRHAARRVPRRRPGPRGRRRATRVVSQGDEATVAYFILDGRGGGRHPRRRRQLSRACRRWAPATSSARSPR